MWYHLNKFFLAIVEIAKERRLNSYYEQELKFVIKEILFNKNRYYHSLFEAIISLHILKIAMKKRTRTSDDEQGINKPWLK